MTAKVVHFLVNSSWVRCRAKDWNLGNSTVNPTEVTCKLCKAMWKR